MKYIKYYLLLFLCFTLLSCNDFLETTPKDFLSPKIFYTTEDQLNSGLRSIYRTLSTYEVYGDKMQYEMALYADEGVPRQAPYTNVRWYNISTSDNIIKNFWIALYKGIDEANFLLENVNKPIMSDDNRKVIKGEALFLRSYFYFLLVQQFGPVPLKLNSSVNLDDGYLARTPIKDVYDQIWNDMIEAESLVLTADKVISAGEVSKSTVQGVLARVALYMAGHPLQDQTKWKDAKYWSQKVIDSGLHELNPDYEQIFINYAQNKYDIKESIFEVEMFGANESPYVNGGRVGMNIGGPTYNSKFPQNTAIYGNTYGFVKSVNWLYKLYQTGDIRRERNIANYYYDSNTGVVKYYGTTLTSSSSAFSRFARKWDRRDESESTRTMANSPQNFPILRYSDVLLMYAEANNEIGGNSDSTYLFVNMVRRRGMKLPVDQISAVADLPNNLSVSDLRTKIREERAKELCYESLRKGDLVRWGIFLERMKATGEEMKTTSWGTNAVMAYFNNVSARDTLWPIPEYDMGLNKKLTQNSGW